METDKFIEAFKEEFTCKHCGTIIKGSFSRYGGGIISKDALESYEENAQRIPIV